MTGIAFTGQALVQALAQAAKDDNCRFLSLSPTDSCDGFPGRAEARVDPLVSVRFCREVTDSPAAYLRSGAAHCLAVPSESPLDLMILPAPSILCERIGGAALKKIFPSPFLL
jgi:hypothetical protein